jgi:tRNA pseudouridine38-40 synthase
MQRYFLEVSYHGKGYSGFQKQDNAITIQYELERSLKTYYREDIMLTGSSRTDAGVHAWQNFFHADTEIECKSKDVYHLNSILPSSIVLKNIYTVKPEQHSRFSAVSREYHYYVYTQKNPFIADRAYFFPYTIDFGLLQQAASYLLGMHDFSSFSKRNTQVKTFDCTIIKSKWQIENKSYVYKVEANRFLRGMVRGLVATMLLVGRRKISIDEFAAIVEAKDCSRADFSSPAHGLFLSKVNFPFDLTPIV